MKKHKPWLKPDGTKKADSEIRRLAANWDQQTWQRYLKSHETPLREQLSEDPWHLDEWQPAATHADLLSDLDGKLNPKLKTAINKALSELMSKEYQVVRFLFWQKCSQKQIAEKLGVHRTTVRRMQSSALAKIEKIMTSRFDASELYKNK